MMEKKGNCTKTGEGRGSRGQGRGEGAKVRRGHKGLLCELPHQRSCYERLKRHMGSEGSTGARSKALGHG